MGGGVSRYPKFVLRNIWTAPYEILLLSDVILVIIGFYVGDEKTDLGRLPFNIILAIVAGIMILSEVSMSIISQIDFLQLFFIGPSSDHSQCTMLLLL